MQFAKDLAYGQTTPHFAIPEHMSTVSVPGMKPPGLHNAPTPPPPGKA